MVAVNVSRCMGCHSCQIACAVEHSAAKELNALVRDGERPGYRIHVEGCDDAAVPLHCQHCEDAPCLRACPTGAIYREDADGPVLAEDSRCIGCRMCVEACPFGVISLRVSGKGVLKCDLCVARLADGLEPACVAACPTRALALIEEAEASRAKRRQAAAALVAARKE
jgi:carbon-monoxide dehydrogenase iron sulfur subunit